MISWHFLSLDKTVYSHSVSIYPYIPSNILKYIQYKAGICTQDGTGTVLIPNRDFLISFILDGVQKQAPPKNIGIHDKL